MSLAIYLSIAALSSAMASLPAKNVSLDDYFSKIQENLLKVDWANVENNMKLEQSLHNLSIAVFCSKMESKPIWNFSVADFVSEFGGGIWKRGRAHAENNTDKFQESFHNFSIAVFCSEMKPTPIWDVSMADLSSGIVRYVLEKGLPGLVKDHKNGVPSSGSNHLVSTVYIIGFTAVVSIAVIFYQ